MTEIIIDTSNLAYACYYAKGYRFANFEGKKTSHIYGFVSKLNSFYNKFGKKGDALVFVFAIDGYPKHVYKVFPGYKANRIRGRFNPVPDIEKIIRTLPCRIIYNRHEEADSVIASYVKKIDDCTIVISSDHDLWQLFGKRVLLADLSGNVISRDYVESKYGIRNPKKICLYKAIFGDKSDNIPKLNCRLPRKKIIDVINSSKTLKSFFSISKRDSHLREIIQNNREQIKFFYKIVKLKNKVKVKQEDIRGDKTIFLKIMKDNGIKKYGSDFWINLKKGRKCYGI